MEKLFPQRKPENFFGIYNVLGRAGAIFGPLMVGGLLTLYGDIRISLLPIAALFILGGLVLLKVNEANEI